MTQPSLTLKILTPEGTLMKKDSLSGVTIPLSNDYPIGIRPGHAPLIAETSQGQVKYQRGSESSSIQLHAGLIEIREDLVTILTPGEVEVTTQDTSIEREYGRIMRTLIQQVKQTDTGEEHPSD